MPFNLLADDDIHPNPFLAVGQRRRSMTARVEAADLEPFSLVDELEFTKRFKDITLLAEQNDARDDAVLLQPSTRIRTCTSLPCTNTWCVDHDRLGPPFIHRKNAFSFDTRQGTNFPPFKKAKSHFALDGINPGFNARLIDPSQLGLHTPRSSFSASRCQSNNTSPGQCDKSLLDDDWLLDRVEHDSNMATVAAGLIRPRSAFDPGRTKTPLPEALTLTYASLHVSKNSSPVRDQVKQQPQPQPQPLPLPPPNDYTCKLCQVSGHWLKDCRLFEPRHNVGGKVSGNVRSLAGLRIGQPPAAASGPANHRPHHPPGNYICRLCGVSGHWIDQCSMFQPNHGVCKPTERKEKLSSFKSIPPPPGYVCNLCHQSGHWLQQCARFEPMHSKPSERVRQGQREYRDRHHY